MSDKMAREQTASMEDYLEAVVMLRSRGEAVRVKDMSEALGVKMPSVTAALKKLADDGLVQHERYGRVILTPEGEKAARDVFNRHEVLRRFLTDVLGVNVETARTDACRMEHSISPVALDRLSKFLGYMEACSEEGSPWFEDYQHYLRCGELP